MKHYRIILAVILAFGLTTSFSPSNAKQAPQKSPAGSQATDSKSQIESKKGLNRLSLQWSLLEKGNKLYVKLNQEVAGLWVDKRRQVAKSLGKGPLIEITPYLSRAKRGYLTLVVLDAMGREHSRKFPVARYTTLLQPDQPKPSAKKKSSLADLEPAKKGVKRSASQPMALPAPQSIIPIPNISVTDLTYVAKLPSEKGAIQKEAASYISFLVKNVGTSKIDRNDFNRIGLTVKIGGRADRSYTKLSQLANYNKIKNPGGMQHCRIPKRLEGRTQVEVEVNVTHAIHKSSKKQFRKNNNRVSKLLGNPLFIGTQPSNKKSSKTLQKNIPDQQKKMKRRDQSQQADRVLQDSRSTAERFVPGPAPYPAAQAPSRPGPDFPAEITSVNCPIAVGASLSIHGRDFGRNEGQVDIALPGATFPCDIFEWGDEHVRCTVPISMGETVGQSDKEAVIWLKPARIEPPDPGTARLPGPGGSGETPYYYSGEEGPRYICSIEPMVPDIDRLSRTDISPLQEVTIHGSNFGEERGELIFNIPGDRYPYAIDIISWSNSRIRMQLSDTTADPYGDTTDRLYSGEDREAEITVTNRSGNSDSADINFEPGDESDYSEVDLHTSNVRISRRTVSGQRQLLIQITVENEEAGTTWRRIRIDLRGLDMAGWIEGGIGGNREEIYTFVYNDSHVGDELDFNVTLDLHNTIPETSTWNNECHVTWRAIDTEREYSCITM